MENTQDQHIAKINTLLVDYSPLEIGWTVLFDSSINSFMNGWQTFSFTISSGKITNENVSKCAQIVKDALSPEYQLIRFETNYILPVDAMRHNYLVSLTFQIDMRM